MEFKSIQSTIGNTPLIEIPIKSGNSTVLAKLEGNNPGGSVKDRPALNMIVEAEKIGLVKPGDTAAILV
jgi:cysteine synthase B